MGRWVAGMMWDGEKGEFAFECLAASRKVWAAAQPALGRNKKLPGRPPSHATPARTRAEWPRLVLGPSSPR